MCDILGQYPLALICVYCVDLFEVLPIASGFDIDFVQDELVGAKVTELDRSPHLDGIFQRAHRPNLVDIDREETPAAGYNAP